MSEEIIKVLDALSEKAGIAVDWSKETIGPYLQKIGTKVVNYEIVTSIMWIVIALVSILIIYVIIKLAFKVYDDDTNNRNKNELKPEDHKDDKSMCLTIGIIFALIFVIVILTQLFDLAKCITYPEKIVIQEITSIYDDLY